MYILACIKKPQNQVQTKIKPKSLTASHGSVLISLFAWCFSLLFLFSILSRKMSSFCFCWGNKFWFCFFYWSIWFLFCIMVLNLFWVFLINGFFFSLSNWHGINENQRNIISWVGFMAFLLIPVKKMFVCFWMSSQSVVVFTSYVCDD